MRVALMIHIPPLLQTTDHAWALSGKWLRFCCKRQEILYRAQALIHEAALRMGFGGPEVARVQLEHIVGVSERGNITVPVLPFGSGAFPGTGQHVDDVYGTVSQVGHRAGRHALRGREVPTYQWRKSSYSGDGSNRVCVCVAVAPDGTVRLRDSKVPSVVVAVGSEALRVFVEAVREGNSLDLRAGWRT